MTTPRRSLAGVTVAVLCTSLFLAGCGFADDDAPSGPDQAVSTSEATPAEDLPGTEPSDLEREVIDAMAAAGVSDPGVAEDGFDTAMVSGAWDGKTAWVHAFPGADAGTPGEVLDDVEVAGVPARVIRTDSFGEVLDVRCGDMGYQVTVLSANGAAGSGTAVEATQFAERLLPALRCAG